MPERRGDDELDDDDEDGSKGEDEEVVAFDESRDLPPSVKMRGSPNKAAVPATGTYVPGRNDRRKSQGNSMIEQPDTPDVFQHIALVTSIPWPPAAGKRPPRDMKRLVQGEWYIVCKVMKWGDTPALFVRSSRDHQGDYGFYKPPSQYYSYLFQVGDRLQLTQVGYSSSRNKVATSIRVKPTHMAVVPESKLHWVAPPVSEVQAEPVMASGTHVKAKKKASDADMSSMYQAQKRKKMRPEESNGHMTNPMRPTFNEQQHAMMHQSFAPLGYAGQGQPTITKKDSKLAFPMFNTQPSLGPGMGGMMSTGLYYTMSDMGLPRNHSFSQFDFGSSGNLIAPQSPLLNGASPLIGGPQPTMHRIPSIGGTFGGPLGSFSVNSPGASLGMSMFAFPSNPNLTATGEQMN